MGALHMPHWKPYPPVLNISPSRAQVHLQSTAAVLWTKQPAVAVIFLSPWTCTVHTCDLIHHRCRWSPCMSFPTPSARMDTATWTALSCTWLTHAASPRLPHHWSLPPETWVSFILACTTPFRLRLGPTPCQPHAAPRVLDSHCATWLGSGWWVAPWPLWLQHLELHSNLKRPWRQNQVLQLIPSIWFATGSKLAEGSFPLPTAPATAPDAVVLPRVATSISVEPWHLGATHIWTSMAWLSHRWHDECTHAAPLPWLLLPAAATAA